MRYISQRGSDDCGISVAAMLTDKSYAASYRADAELHKVAHPIGMKYREFLALLDRVAGYRWRVTKRGFGRRLRDFARDLEPGEYALIIRETGTLYGHYVAVDVSAARVVVYDPEMEKPLSLDDYRERGAWKVVRVFSPFIG